MLLFEGCPTQHCSDHQKNISLTLNQPCVNMKKAKWQLIAATSLIHNLSSYTKVFIRKFFWTGHALRLMKPQHPCSCCLSCPLHNLNWSPALPSWWRLRGAHSCETSQPTRHLFRDLNMISPSPYTSCSKAAIQGPPQARCQGHRDPVWAGPGAKIVKPLCLF